MPQPRNSFVCQKPSLSQSTGKVVMREITKGKGVTTNWCGFRISSGGNEGKLKKAICSPPLKNVPGAAEFLCPDVMILTKFIKAEKLSVNRGDVVACSKGQVVCQSPWSWYEFGWWRGKELHMGHCGISSRVCDQGRVTSMPYQQQHPCLLSVQFHWQDVLPIEMHFLDL